MHALIEILEYIVTFEISLLSSFINISAMPLRQIAALPLATYEMKHDSVKGRRHLGPLGPGLEKTLPGSVEIHGKSTYPSPTKVRFAGVLIQAIRVTVVLRRRQFHGSSRARTHEAKFTTRLSTSGRNCTKQGEPPITLENQAVVDKSVIFMNNVAAVQELAERSEAMWAQVSVSKPETWAVPSLYSPCRSEYDRGVCHGTSC